MPIESETNTSGTNTTVTVRNPAGPGGSKKYIDVFVSIEPGKVVHDKDPLGAHTFDSNKLTAWWRQIEIAVDAESSVTYKVKRKPGAEFEGPVPVTAVVCDSTGGYFQVHRSCLCGTGRSLFLAATGSGRSVLRKPDTIQRKKKTGRKASARRRKKPSTRRKKS